MTKVTYLDHSGFALTTPEVILVFDYFRDPSHSLEKLLDHNKEMPVIFFASHRHPDHYNSAIFNLAQNHERVYVLSNDIVIQQLHKGVSVATMSKGDVLEDLPGDTKVKAFGSTDEGICFLVTTKDGTTILHAGDLNDWHWKDTSTEREAQKAENDFKVIVNRIKSEYPAIDIVMFPVDPRQGSDFARGATTLLDEIKVGDFFPMHFQGEHSEACDFAEYIPAGNASCHCLSVPGESITL